MVKKITDIVPEDKHLDFGVIVEDLDKLIETYLNKIDREYPFSKGKEIFFIFACIAKNTHKTIRYISVDKNPPPFQKIEYSLSSIPLNRLILEIIFSVIYISSDLENKIDKYYKSGWRELKERYDIYYKEYANDPNWKEWLTGKREFIEKFKKDLGIKDEETANLKLIKYWPIPGQMTRDDSLNENLKGIIKYLTDWFYKEYSQATHLTWPGVSHLGCCYIQDDEETKAVWLQKLRSDGVADSVTLILALLSEFEIIFNFDQKERLQYLWGIFKSYYPKAEELYIKRYKGYFNDK